MQTKILSGKKRILSRPEIEDAISNYLFDKHNIPKVDEIKIIHEDGVKPIIYAEAISLYEEDEEDRPTQ